MGPDHRPYVNFLDADELELRAMLTASLLGHLHPVAHRFITPVVIEALMDDVYAFIDKTVALESER